MLRGCPKNSGWALLGGWQGELFRVKLLLGNQVILMTVLGSGYSLRQEPAGSHTVPQPEGGTLGATESPGSPVAVHRQRGARGLRSDPALPLAV